MTELSPQAQAIINAYENTTDKYDAIAAVIRELVNQLQYQSFHHTEGYYQLDARDILDVSAELERI